MNEKEIVSENEKEIVPGNEEKLVPGKDNSLIDAVRELKWKEFTLRVEHYKHYLNIALQVNAFFYVTTGAVLGVYLKYSLELSKDYHLVYFLLLPILIGSVLRGVFIYGADLQKSAYESLDVVKKELDGYGFKMEQVYDARPLYLLFKVFGWIFFLVAFALIPIPLITWTASFWDLVVFIFLSALIMYGGYRLPALAHNWEKLADADDSETSFPSLLMKTYVSLSGEIAPAPQEGNKTEALGESQIENSNRESENKAQAKLPTN
ncbi:MAG TPA: hypothetical protein VK400_11295 [Pyrinomonadaceae bacterium]|nr:hypothetical protein [Pyrinomonadaceae bacterium]